MSMGQARFTVVGAGAIGLLFAARLGLSGCRVELCARRTSQMEALMERGICVRNGPGEAVSEDDAILHPEVRLLEQASLAGGGGAEFHFIILAVKQAAFTQEFVRQVERLMRQESRLVCLQNGIGHIEALSGIVPKDRIFAAVTTEGAMKLSDHEIIHTGRGTTWIGPVTSERGQADDKSQKKLAELLNLAGFQTFLSKNITSRVWQKLIINSVINPLTAILQVKNGELLQQPEALGLMRTLFDEAVSAARQLQLPLDPDLWEQLLEVCRKTAENRSSMLQDLAAGRRTEIDNITGGIVKEAEKAGLVVPAHQTIYRIIKALEAGAAAGGRTQQK